MANNQIFIGIGIGIIIMSLLMICIFLQHKHDIGKFLSKVENYSDGFSKDTVIFEMKRQKSVLNILIVFPAIMFTISIMIYTILA